MGTGYELLKALPLNYGEYVYTWSCIKRAQWRNDDSDRMMFTTAVPSQFIEQARQTGVAQGLAATRRIRRFIEKSEVAYVLAFHHVINGSKTSGKCGAHLRMHHETCLGL